MKNRHITAFILLMAGTLAVRFFGLLREILLAKYYGTGIYTDAYVIANNIPTVLYAAIGSAVSITYVPMYSRAQTELGDARAKRFTWNLLKFLLIVYLFLCLAGEIFTKQVVFLFASGYRGEERLVTIRFTRILLPSLFPVVVTKLLASYMTIYGEFVASATVSVVSNVLIIFSLYLSDALNNVYIFVVGTLIGISSQAICILAEIHRKKLSIRTGEFKTPLLKDEYIRLILPLMVPMFLGTAVTDINTMIDKTLVSGQGVGAVSSLNYAAKIVSLATSIVMGSITYVYYPEISRYAASKEWGKFRDILQRLMSIALLFAFPMTALLLIFPQEIVFLLFQRGGFDETSTRFTAEALVFYAFGIAGTCMRDVEAKVFYALQNTKTPTINGVLCAGANVVLNILLIRRMGIAGAALATALVELLAAGILGMKLRQYNMIEFPVKNIAKISFAALTTYVPIWFLWTRRFRPDVFGYASVWSMVLMGIAFVSLYAALLYVLRVEEARSVIASILLRLKG